MKYLILTVALIGTLLTSCGESEKTEESGKKKRPFAWFRNVMGNFRSKDTVYFDSVYVDKFIAQYPSFKKYQKELRDFYSERNYSYAWFDRGGMIEQGDNLYYRVKETKFDGVDEAVPYQQKFDELMDRPNRKRDRDELELMLTSQYFGLAYNVWKGLDDSQVKKQGWFIPRQKVSYASFLDSMLQGPEDEFLEKEPLNPQYESLKGHLKRYIQLDSLNANYTPITAPKKAIKSGDSAAIIPAVRARLAQLGDLAQDNKLNLFDAELEQAVISFQQRHGLAEGPQIDKSFIAELNVPIKERLRTIAVNMERSRWVPMNYSGTNNYLLVNIPEYKLHVMENNKQAWECNVVVGKDENKTVIFKGTLDHIVFSPHWNVPESIVKEEILPEIEKDPDYLEKQDLEINGERNGLPVIRQKPGKENSLGLVKFMFPNTYNIYLHDTPAKALFDRNDRAFSHGCVRVSEPVKLAAYLLRGQSEWTDQRIDEAMHSGEEKYVTLKTKMPVYITYFTSWVDPQGRLNFRKDIYDNDARLANMVLN